MINLKWKREIFSKTTKILNNNSEKGELINEMFSDSATAKINNEKFRFYKPDFFSRKTLIKDSNKKQIIGNIHYDFWKSKASIKLNKKEYYLKSESFWRGKWSLSDKSEKLIEYRAKSTSGMIKTSIENDLLLLIGLYITNNYQKGYWTSIIAIIVIIMIRKG